MLSMTLNSLVQNNKFRPFCVFELKNGQVNNPPGKSTYCTSLFVSNSLCLIRCEDFKVLVVSDLDVVAYPPAQIGHPVSLQPAGGQQQGQSPTRPPQQGGQPRPLGVQQAKPAPMQRPPPQGYQQGQQYQQQQPQQRSPQRSGMQPIPINALNPYISRWMIKARVSQKSDMKEYTRGSYFTCSFLDADSTEIRAAFFAEAATQFIYLIAIGKV